MIDSDSSALASPIHASAMLSEMDSSSSAAGSFRLLGLALLATLTFLGLATASSAQVHRTIESLGPSDLMKSERQRQRADELALRFLGTPLRGGDLRNLKIVQRILDGGFISKEDVMDQQSLGVVLGDVMAQNLHLTWIVVDDKIGRSRALRWRDTQPIFFPVTMISKRVSAGEKVNTEALFKTVSDEVDALEASYGPSRRKRTKPARTP